MADSKRWTIALGLLGAVWGLGGCGKQEPVSLPATQGHGHAHTAKYGGVLVEVGSHEFNLEVLVDPAAGKLTLWTLDAHAEAYVRIAAPQIELVAKVNDGPEVALVAKPVANPATGEVAGSSAQFEAVSAALKGAKDVEGQVKSIILGSKTFSGIRFDWPHGADEGHAH